jgi:hypothetical protein
LTTNNTCFIYCESNRTTNLKAENLKFLLLAMPISKPYTKLSGLAPNPLGGINRSRAGQRILEASGGYRQSLAYTPM